MYPCYWKNQVRIFWQANFIIVVEYKTIDRISTLPSGSKYDKFGFTRVDRHFIWTEPIGNFLHFCVYIGGQLFEIISFTKTSSVNGEQNWEESRISKKIIYVIGESDPVYYLELLRCLFPEGPICFR